MLNYTNYMSRTNRFNTTSISGKAERFKAGFEKRLTAKGTGAALPKTGSIKIVVESISTSKDE